MINVTKSGMRIVGLMAVGLLLTTTLGVTADDDENPAGTWRTSETVPDLNIFGVPGLMSIGPGADSDDGGTVVFSDPGLFGLPCLPLQGVWEMTGERRFIGTNETFCAENGEGFTGIRATYSLKLNKSGNKFKGAYNLEFIDDAGENAFGGFIAYGTMNGVRMKAQAPVPAPTPAP